VQQTPQQATKTLLLPQNGRGSVKQFLYGDMKTQAAESSDRGAEGQRPGRRNGSNTTAGRSSEIAKTGLQGRQGHTCMSYGKRETGVYHHALTKNNCMVLVSWF